MHVMHLALGGCLKAPPVRFGATEDTGGHIAYLLGAAEAQAARSDVARIDLVTRRFDAPALGAAHALRDERVDGKTRIRRIDGGGDAYLDKDALEAALPALREAFLALVARGPRPDVIHAHFADAAELALAARDRFGIPVVYTPHSLGIDKGQCAGTSPALARRIERERAAIAGADAIVVSSRDEAERQVAAYGIEAAGRTHRLNPGIWLCGDTGGTGAAEALVRPFLSDPDKPMILAIARPVAKKNLPGLLDAYAGTEGLRDAANLVVLAGLRDGPDSGNAEQRDTIRALLHGIDRHDLWGRVALPRRHEARHVPQLYRLAAKRGGVFANPALHEPFGLTILEAARHDLPVVATDRGGPRDIVATMGHGTCVDPTDAAAWGEALLRAVTDRAARDAHVAHARRNRDAYSWAAYAERASALYARLATRRAPRRRIAPDRLLVCDIDGTLTGSRAGARRLSRWMEGSGIPFVVATGRSLPEARRILADWSLPEPDAWITAVGSEVHRVRADGWTELDGTYADWIGAGWDVVRAAAALDRLGATFQDAVEQRLWKLGLHGDRVEALRIARGLRNAGIDATVIHSHEHLIDVLPPRGDKAAAMARVAATYGLTVADCIACGDSGNDVAMLQAAGTAILVGNVLPEVDLGPRRGLIRASAPHADGILEGLSRLGLAEGGAARTPPPRYGEARA